MGYAIRTDVYGWRFVDSAEDCLEHETYSEEQPAPYADPNAGVDAEIRELEASITPRRLREALLTTEGAAWLAEVDARIAALRAQRV